jgi:hypothetical protein
MLLTLVLVWAAVFLLAFVDRLRGTSLRFFGGGRYHVPRLPSLAWWQHAIRVPYYALVLLSLTFFYIAIFPPMFVVDLPRRLRERSSLKT